VDEQPERRLTGMSLTQHAVTSPEPASLFVDFWDAASGARAG
jgi:hypothetical protein